MNCSLSSLSLSVSSLSQPMASWFQRKQSLKETVLFLGPGTPSQRGVHVCVVGMVVHLKISFVTSRNQHAHTVHSPCGKALSALAAPAVPGGGGACAVGEGVCA